MFWLLQNGSFAVSQQKQRASSSDLYHEGLISHKWWSGCKTRPHGGSASAFPTFAPVCRDSVSTYLSLQFWKQRLALVLNSCPLLRRVCTALSLSGGWECTLITIFAHPIRSQNLLANSWPGAWRHIRGLEQSGNLSVLGAFHKCDTETNQGWQRCVTVCAFKSLILVISLNFLSSKFDTLQE